MGISNYLSWLVGHYEKHNVIQPASKQYFDHVYFDLNVIMHIALTDSSTEAELYEYTFLKIEQLLGYMKPRKTLTIAADGIPPFAKFNLQRERRFKNSTEYNLEDCLSLSLTPGTTFMTNMKMNLLKFINSNIKNRYRDVIISTSVDDIGEAEIKIGSFISRNHKKYGNKDTHCVFTPDTDVIVIMAGLCIPNIFINNGKKIINIDNLIMEHFVSNLKKYDICGFYEKNVNSFKYDFVVVSLLFGNDYFPKLAYINIEDVWNNYFLNISRLYNNIQTLNIINDDDNSMSNIFMTLINDDGVLIINRDTMICFLEMIISSATFKKWMNKFDNIEYNKQIYEDYIYSVQWCANMYMNNDKFDFTHMFSYDYSIHPMGLLLYLKYKNANEKDHDDNNNCFNDFAKRFYEKKELELTNQMYAIMVMPFSSRNMIYDVDKINLDSDKYKKLYDIEFCNVCKEYIDMINPLKKAERDTEDFKKKNQLSGILGDHKKQSHKKFNLDDIYCILNHIKNDINDHIE